MDVEDMEDPRDTQDARMPGEKREVFLARLFLRLLNHLGRTDTSGDLLALREAAEVFCRSNLRSGRARPNGRA